MYSVICRELASYGYIVFSMGHQDGSQVYTTDKDGNSLFHDGAKEGTYLEDMRS